jgi:hypothetical protein
MVWHRFMAEAHEGLKPQPLPGNYWRNPDDSPAIAGFEDRVDQIQPDPSAPAPASGGGFRIDSNFLKRIFGG